MKSRSTVSRLILIAAVGGVAALLPLVVRSPRWIHVLGIVAYYILLASSWNLIMGYTGLFSFAHMAMAAIGGYASGLAAVRMGVHPWLGMPLGGLGAAVASMVLGTVSLRLRGFYLCLVTWAFAEISINVLRSEYEVTGGTMGLMVPRLFASEAGSTPYYLVGLGLVVAHVAFMVLVMNSRVGLYLRSLRDDALASEAMGVNTTFWKVFSFTVAGFWAGLAGAYYGHFIGVVDPGMGALTRMGLVILMVVVGGIGTISGPILGAAVVVILSEFLRGRLEAASMLIFATLMILVTRFSSGGLMAGLAMLLRRASERLRLPGPSRGLD